MLPEGYFEVAAGHIAAVVTYLEVRQPPQLPEPSPAFPIERLTEPDLERYRRVFRAVGEGWLWFSRLRLSDDELAALLAHPQVDVFLLRADNRDQGILELDRRAFPDIEITFLGVTANLVGQGAGHALMVHAQRQAWSHNPTRLFLHTCTLDHPKALAFYQRAGFVPYRRRVEVALDPRLIGLLPETAAPHVPLLAKPVSPPRPNPANLEQP